jgi:alkylation response protein AidB-like acyl-CoA dehydrogenase
VLRQDACSTRKERKAFGREIGKFQVIRHKFAEMATKIESARQMVYITAWRFNNGEYPVREISMAKLTPHECSAKWPTSASRSTAARAT